MLFNIERDSGDVIEGYLIPDGFSDQPSIEVFDDDCSVLVLPCDQPRLAVSESGRHGGRVGFRVDGSNIPHLESISALVIRDAKTGVLIYRRARADGCVARKIVRLETSIVPNLRLDNVCGSQFQYDLYCVERFGHETALQVFHLHSVNSIYLSGRLLMRNYEEFLDKGFDAITFLVDPYYEMATRIALLRRMSVARLPFLGDRDLLMLRAAAEHFVNVDLEDDKSLSRALKNAPQKVRNVLVSPVTRQLAATTPEQICTRMEIAPALDLLSRFAVVGHEADPLHFSSAVAALTGASADRMVAPTQYEQLSNIALRLRSLPIAELLLENDLIFDHYVRDALGTKPCGLGH